MVSSDIGEFYVANLPPLVDALQLAIPGASSGDQSATESVRRIAHQLKGSGATYGFPEVTEAASAVMGSDGSELIAAARALLDLLLDLVSSSQTPHARLVVIDDDPLMQAVIGRVIGTSQRDIRYAGTGDEGLHLLEDGADLVVLDLFLPDMDGRDVLRQIRRRPALANTRVVVLSGADSDLARAESIALGADAFLGKPFDAAVLSTIVASMLTAPQEDRVPHQPAGAVAQKGPASIVVAEDDQLVASLVVDRLERERYNVVHEADGAAALKRIMDVVPDLVILDVKLPRMNGFEVLKRIRSNPQTSETTVMVLTAMGGEHDVVRGFDLGADDYLLKPFSPAELLARVKHHLDHP